MQHVDGLLVAGTRMAIPGFREFVRTASGAVKSGQGEDVNGPRRLSIYVNRESCQQSMQRYFDYQFLGETDVFASRVMEHVLMLQMVEWGEEMERRGLEGEEFDEWGCKRVIGGDGQMKRRWSRKSR